MSTLNRRSFIKTTGVAVAASAVGTGAMHTAATAAQPAAQGSPTAMPMPILKTLKFGMVNVNAPIVEKFKLLKRLGYHGVELDSPNNFSRDEVIRARDEAEFPICSVIDSIHWNIRLSDPDPAVRERGRAGLETAIRDIHAYGGSSVLLVPGKVTGANETQQHVWERSIEQIQKMLPLCAELGIHILIENVWNGFCYDHNGPDNQTADQLAAYIDEINSPWVGVHFDIGNHQKYGPPAEWIRTLGKRIVKLDVKDWGKANGWAAIGDGDVDWPEVRKALAEINFTGWASAEVGGGGEAVLADILARMNRCLGEVA